LPRNSSSANLKATEPEIVAPLTWLARRLWWAANHLPRLTRTNTGCGWPGPQSTINSPTIN